MPAKISPGFGLLACFTDGVYTAGWRALSLSNPASKGNRKTHLLYHSHPKLTPATFFVQRVGAYMVIFAPIQRGLVIDGIKAVQPVGGKPGVSKGVKCLVGRVGQWDFLLTAVNATLPSSLHQLAPGRVIVGQHKTQGAQNFTEMRARKRHGAYLAPVQTFVGTYQVQARLGEFGWFFNTG